MQEKEKKKEKERRKKEKETISLLREHNHIFCSNCKTVQSLSCACGQVGGSHSVIENELNGGNSGERERWSNL